MVKRTKVESEETRQTILESARCLFLENGFAHTSLNEIAIKSNATRGAIYFHFKNKYDILHTLADETFLPHEEFLERFARTTGKDILGDLQKECMSVFISIIDDPERRRIFTILTQRCEYCTNKDMKIINDRILLCRTRMLDLFVSLFGAIQENGDLSPDWMPDSAALALYGLFSGFVAIEMEHEKARPGRTKGYTQALRALFTSFQKTAAERAAENRGNPHISDRLLAS